MTRFPDLLGWQRHLEADDHAVYQRRGWAIHLYRIGDEDYLAELLEPDGHMLDSSLDGNIHELADYAAELDDDDDRH